MNADDGPLTQLVRRMRQRTAHGEAVSIGVLQELAGARGAGPILLLPALIVVSPLSIVPGLPTIIGMHTIIVAGQVVLGRKAIWLPGWLSRRSLSAKHAEKLLKFLVPLSVKTDGVVKRRMLPLTGPLPRKLGAAVCVLIGALMPLLEFIPMSSTIAAAAIATYALSISARDGILTIVWWGAIGFVAALGLWVVPELISLVPGVDAPQVLRRLDGTPIELLKPFLSDPHQPGELPNHLAR